MVLYHCNFKYKQFCTAHNDVSQWFKVFCNCAHFLFKSRLFTWQISTDGIRFSDWHLRWVKLDIYIYRKSYTYASIGKGIKILNTNFGTYFGYFFITKLFDDTLSLKVYIVISIYLDHPWYLYFQKIAGPDLKTHVSSMIRFLPTI
jgi:hypothetical protein